MNQGSHKNDGGETPGRREAMDRMRKQLVEQGNSDAYAREVVKRCALNADRIADRRR